MYSWFLDDIGNELAKKPFEHVSWWWGPKWSSFINIDSPLSIDKPLWSREENSLGSVRLFGLRPNELHDEIIQYWQQPFWKRWLLSLFTPIRNKIKLWSYYQRCLSFRQLLKKDYLFDEPGFVFGLYLKKEARQGLKRCRIQLENYLEKRAGNLKWIQNNEFFIVIHFQKNWNYFKKLIKKELARLFSEEERSDLRKKFQVEYFRLQDILLSYLSNWSKNIFTPCTFKAISNSNTLVCIDSSVEKQSSYQLINKRISNGICSLQSIKAWIKSQQQAIKSMLQEESSERFLKIENLLESCLSEIRLLIDFQLTYYKDMIDKVRCGQFDCDAASQQAETMLTNFIYFFRKGVLLFHPDKSFGNEKLQEIQTKLFKIFHELSKQSLEKIREGLPILQDCLFLQKTIQECLKMKQKFDLRTAKMEQQIEELRLFFQKFETERNQDFVKMKTDLKEVRIEIETTQIKIDKYIQSQARSKLIHKSLSQKENACDPYNTLECVPNYSSVSNCSA